MGRIERKIRKMLIEERAEELYKSMISKINDPDYMKELKELYVKLCYNAIEHMAKESGIDVDAKYAKIRITSNAKEMVSDFDKILKDEKRKKREAFKLAKKEFGKDSKFGFVSKINNKIVEGLTEIAKDEKFEEAMKEETKYKVIKNLFPEPDEYKKYKKSVFENYDRLYWQSVLKLPISRKIEDPKVKSLISEIAKKSEEYDRKRFEEELEEELQKIYGL